MSCLGHGSFFMGGGGGCGCRLGIGTHGFATGSGLCAVCWSLCAIDGAKKPAFRFGFGLFLIAAVHQKMLLLYVSLSVLY